MSGGRRQQVRVSGGRRRVCTCRYPNIFEPFTKNKEAPVHTCWKRVSYLQTCLSSRMFHVLACNSKKMCQKVPKKGPITR